MDLDRRSWRPHSLNKKIVLRVYRRRQREERVEELDDVLAFRPGEHPPFGVIETKRVSHDVLRPFEKAGWRFLDRETAERLPDGAGETARVIKHRDRIVLSKGRLTAKFRGGLSHDDVEKMVTSAGCRIVQRLPIADNTFLLEPSDPKGTDPFALAEALATYDGTEFVEPEFIEELGGR